MYSDEWGELQWLSSIHTSEWAPPDVSGIISSRGATARCLNTHVMQKKITEMVQLEERRTDEKDSEMISQFLEQERVKTTFKILANLVDEMIEELCHELVFMREKFEVECNSILANALFSGLEPRPPDMNILLEGCLSRYSEMASRVRPAVLDAELTTKRSTIDFRQLPSKLSSSESYLSRAQIVPIEPFSVDEPISCIETFPDQSIVACGTQFGRVFMWSSPVDLRTPNKAKDNNAALVAATAPLLGETRSPVKNVAVSSNSLLFLSLGVDGVIRVWKRNKKSSKKSSVVAVDATAKINLKNDAITSELRRWSIFKKAPPNISAEAPSIPEPFDPFVKSYLCTIDQHHLCLPGLPSQGGLSDQSFFRICCVKFFSPQVGSILIGCETGQVFKLNLKSQAKEHDVEGDGVMDRLREKGSFVAGEYCNPLEGNQTGEEILQSKDTSTGATSKSTPHSNPGTWHPEFLRFVKGSKYAQVVASSIGDEKLTDFSAAVYRELFLWHKAEIILLEAPPQLNGGFISMDQSAAIAKWTYSEDRFTPMFWFEPASAIQLCLSTSTFEDSATSNGQVNPVFLRLPLRQQTQIRKYKTSIRSCDGLLIEEYYPARVSVSSESNKSSLFSFSCQTPLSELELSNGVPISRVQSPAVGCEQSLGAESTIFRFPDLIFRENRASSQSDVENSRNISSQQPDPIASQKQPRLPVPRVCWICKRVRELRTDSSIHSSFISPDGGEIYLLTRRIPSKSESKQQRSQKIAGVQDSYMILRVSLDSSQFVPPHTPFSVKNGWDVGGFSIVDTSESRCERSKIALVLTRCEQSGQAFLRIFDLSSAQELATGSRSQDGGSSSDDRVNMIVPVPLNSASLAALTSQLARDAVLDVNSSWSRLFSTMPAVLRTGSGTVYLGGQGSITGFRIEWNIPDIPVVHDTLSTISESRYASEDRISASEVAQDVIDHLESCVYSQLEDIININERRAGRVKEVLRTSAPWGVVEPTDWPPKVASVRKASIHLQSLFRRNVREANIIGEEAEDLVVQLTTEVNKKWQKKRHRRETVVL